MGKQIITISSILGGWQTSDYFNSRGQFLSSVAIDPDMPADDTGNKPCGYIRPTSMTKFSDGNLTGVPLWFVTNPKNSNTYLYANDGKVHTVNSSLVFSSGINSGTALTASSGNGAEYYDNAAYFAKNADICRYYPLNGSPALTQNYWTTTLSLTAPRDTTYPSINGVEMPNHVMFRHTDDRLYFADVDANNKGILSYIKTTKTSVEGDTDDGSAYSALDFDYGQYVTSISSYNTDLAVALIEGTNTTVKQKPAKIAFWDTTSASFSKITDVELADPLITAIKNVDGVLWVFSGFATGGCRVSRFVGGYSIEEIAWLPEVYPPISQGAIDHILNRVVFGSATKEPETSGSVFAIGGKSAGFSMGLQNICRATGTGANPWVTAVKYLTQTSGAIQQPVIGWDDDA